MRHARHLDLVETVEQLAAPIQRAAWRAGDAGRTDLRPSGPSLDRCAETTEAWSNELQLPHLLDITTLSLLVGNCDAHPKNLSLLHSEDGRIELALIYDVMSTLYHENVETTLGMFIRQRRHRRSHPR